MAIGEFSQQYLLSLLLDKAVVVLDLEVMVRITLPKAFEDPVDRRLVSRVHLGNVLHHHVVKDALSRDILVGAGVVIITGKSAQTIAFVGAFTQWSHALVLVGVDHVIDAEA